MSRRSRPHRRRHAARNLDIQFKAPRSWSFHDRYPPRPEMTHRIVQLTDCHLFADPEQSLRGIVTWPRLAAVLDNIRRRVLDVELLVLTGDTAHDDARVTYESVRNVLAVWGGRVRVIPGNHDHRAFLRDLFPQESGGPVGRVTFHTSWSDWQAIGLDSQQPGELPGSLGGEQLASDLLIWRNLLWHRVWIGGRC